MDGLMSQRDHGKYLFRGVNKIYNKKKKSFFIFLKNMKKIIAGVLFYKNILY